MIEVKEAEQIIQAETRQYGTETIPFKMALGRVLAEEIISDRDLPPYDRVTMDGIAISYPAFEKGISTYKIKGTQAAGDNPIPIHTEDECVEIMTGAALPEGTDTVIRYEDIEITDGDAVLKTKAVKKGQSLHLKGSDKKQGEVIACAHQFVTPAIISIAATVGKKHLEVKKMPRVIIISTGDELVEVHETPLPYQIRRSNVYSIEAALHAYSMHPTLLHLPDNPHIIKEKIKESLLHYDVILLSGGISQGKFDYVPQVLEKLQVKKLFHKVRQRPGKPFWFGKHTNNALVFAFPGNPVSTFMCLYRYFLPWLEASLGIAAKPKPFAVLGEDFSFLPPLQYFLQVKISINDSGQLTATPAEGNGSGDFANLIATEAFMELPSEEINFKKGTSYRIWPFKQIIT